MFRVQFLLTNPKYFLLLLSFRHICRNGHLCFPNGNEIQRQFVSSKLIAMEFDSVLCPVRYDTLCIDKRNSQTNVNDKSNAYDLWIHVECVCVGASRLYDKCNVNDNDAIHTSSYCRTYNVCAAQSTSNQHSNAATKPSLFIFSN